MGQYKNYTDKDIIEKSQQANSLTELLSLLGLKPVGGNFANLKRNLQRLNLECSHWKGSAWNKGERLKDWSKYSRAVNLKPHLIKLRGHVCERCKNTDWLGEPIPLEIEHCDGDRTNNTENNLKLLCCNCHAKTPTWRRRKNK